MEGSRPGLLKILHKKNIINKEAVDVDEINNGFKESQEEPNSPTISCVGQVKSRKKCDKNLHLFFRRRICPFSSSSSSSSSSTTTATTTACRRKKPSVIKPVFYLTEDEKIPTKMRNNNNVERKSGCKLRAMCRMNKSFGPGEGRVSKSDWNTAVSKCKQGDNKEESSQFGNKVDVSGDGCKLREKANCLMSKMNRSSACRRGGLLANFDWTTMSEEDDHELREKADCLMSKMNRSIACRRGGLLANFDWKTMIEEDEDKTGEKSCCEKVSACFSKMNRSTACRRGGALANFDWREVEDDEQGHGYDHGAKRQQSVAVQTIRKEINLWERRTFAKPVPIQLIASISILATS